MKWFITPIICCIFPLLINAQDLTYVPNMSDIRGSGMGKTCIAGTKTSNALFTNPALLGALENINVVGAFRLQFGIINDEEMDDFIKSLEYVRSH